MKDWWERNADAILWGAFWFFIILAILGYSMYPLALIFGWR